MGANRFAAVELVALVAIGEIERYFGISNDIPVNYAKACKLFFKNAGTHVRFRNSGERLAYEEQEHKVLFYEGIPLCTLSKKPDKVILHLSAKRIGPNLDRLITLIKAEIEQLDKVEKEYRNAATPIK